MRGTVLLVEDNPDDVMLFKWAVRSAGLQLDLRVAESGQEALDYLFGEGAYGDRRENPLPCLVLLDLKLPFVPGLEVLKAIRSRAETRRLAVVILTSSQADSDVEQAYEIGANSYLVKPSNVEERVELVRRISAYWLESNTVPSSMTAVFEVGERS